MKTIYGTVAIIGGRKNRTLDTLSNYFKNMGCVVSPKEKNGNKMEISIYDGLVYEEDERVRIPGAYADNGTGNRLCQHIIISDKDEVKKFFDKYNLTGIKDNYISLSILWHLPRRSYSESKMWVCLSGCTYGKKIFYPKTFVISDNIVTKEAQGKAIEMLSYIKNNFLNVEVTY